ncbi:TetR/AcrR family transcriptional regulator [Phytomonospora sp. NPDC050363]|uniref:TetR/AcrR family transcriptional regulator n=1 Tax=Phytomonospora sp. NPDC050363 TaxID=3155642 RepID=UPI0033EFBBA7
MGDSRSTAPRRREHAVAVGMRVFADQGLTTGAIQRVAEEIGVSQSYVFRLFGSKLAFFLACLDEMEARVTAVFGATAAAESAEPFEAMGAGFRELVADGTISGLWLQASALARGDEEVAARCRSLITAVLTEAGRLTGAPPPALAAFLADGALVMLLQAVGADLTGGSRAAVVRLLDETRPS